MKKYISLFIPALLLYSAAQAQQDINSVLKSIESRNKTLQAESRLHETRQLEAHTGNYLANPTVELNQLWADRSAGGNVNELAVVQGFDFPTVYTNKHKLADLKATTSGYQYAVSRQQILLSAQQLCLEVIYLHKQKKRWDTYTYVRSGRDAPSPSATFYWRRRPPPIRNWNPNI